MPQTAHSADDPVLAGGMRPTKAFPLFRYLSASAAYALVQHVRCRVAARLVGSDIIRAVEAVQEILIWALVQSQNRLSFRSANDFWIAQIPEPGVQRWGEEC
jgi:hypothetical protein